MRLLYPRHWLGYRSTAGRISAKAWHVGYRRLSTSTSLDSSVKNRNSGGKGLILGISALCATAASGYMFYDALNIPPCVKAAIVEIRTNKTIREHLGDRITLRSDWTVEERGDRAVVRVNASGNKSGGMFTCLLSRSETGWNIVTVDMIYNEPRPATDTLNSAPVYDALDKAGAK
ncbi:Cytochrome oxidase complex assembly protein 1 family protein [Babesia bovis T2Bo]|uniref:Cytochrome oxidase complex assembly protein 1 family protein n=1 Tax=Babesia bovis T2Bo TaxID=484906 RepID=UPI001D61D169|nr:Cytochrome oxidase complex assembly protein 1 family protein [Babesia bovis T2Bo]KAG6439921.1 Cytochrome oxidase complex assembly protein 1 family protein [Babesia bovis T2Bo]